MFFRKSKYNSEKIFVIGLGKTGTTSTGLALEELGYCLGNQRKGENLVENWAARDFKTIVQFCHTADAFQDVPFCLPYTFVMLDQYFPRAKFILTVRDNEELWYDSLVRFHSKMFANNKSVPPTRFDLENATYIYKGRPYRTNRLMYDTPEDQPYEPVYMKEYYLRHLKNVREYFRHYPGYGKKILEINVGIPQDYERFCRFLGRSPLRNSFPWENKT